jgi:hypothetical protein
VTHEPVFATRNAFDLELLSWLDVIDLPNFGGENDLALRGNRRSHIK